MGIFNRDISRVRDLMVRIGLRSRKTAWDLSEVDPWPAGGGNLWITAADTSVELGAPDLPSALLTLITDHPSWLTDGRITLLGPDISELEGRRASIAKIIFVEAPGVKDGDLYDFFIDVNLARLGASLSGCMTRASSGMNRDWCRISREAVRAGISVSHIAGGEMACIRRVAGVGGVEAVVVTSSEEDVVSLARIAVGTQRVISALCKISTETLHDCAACEFSDLCSSLDELKGLREARTAKTG